MSLNNPRPQQRPPWRVKALVLLAVLQITGWIGLTAIPASPASAGVPVVPLLAAFLARKALFGRYAVTFDGNRYTVAAAYFCETLPTGGGGRTELLYERSFRTFINLNQVSNVANTGTLVLYVAQSDQMEIVARGETHQLKPRHPFMTFLDNWEMKADDYDPAWGKYDVRPIRTYQIQLAKLGLGQHMVTLAEMDMKNFPGVGGRGGRDRIPTQVQFVVDPTDPDSIGGKAVPVSSAQAASAVPAPPSTPPASVPDEPICQDVIDNRIGQTITLLFNGQAPTPVPPGVSTLQLPCPPEGIKITANLAALALPSSQKVVVDFLDGKEGAAELGANPSDNNELFLPTGSGRSLRTRVLLVKPRR